MSTAALLVAACAAVAVMLQGCGGGGDTSHTATTTGAPIVPPAHPPSGKTDLRPLRGIGYMAVPDVPDGVAFPGPDMMQAGYKPQWGPGGRDDMGMIKTLGANTVRLYHSLGSEDQTDHSQFLDRAEELGLHVLVGFHTQNVCPEFDCYAAWKAAMTAGFKQGLQKNGKWHPAVSMVILLDAPDNLNFNANPAPPNCTSLGLSEAVCRVKASLSALDGFLDAEQAANIEAGSVNITIAWSFDTKDSIDKKVTGPGIFGFADMAAGIADPDLAKYKPNTGKKTMAAAYESRWVNSINTGATWSFVKEKVADVYESNGFSQNPWFIAEFTADTASMDIPGDLKAMDVEAKVGPFLGVTFTSFQKDYQAGPDVNHGLFGLGDTEVASKSNVCENDVLSRAHVCVEYPVYCLDVAKGDPNRASSVADAWGGSVVGHGTCHSSESIIAV